MRPSAKSMLISTLLSALILTAVNVAQAQRLKVFISADMEGVAGVVTEQQLNPAGFEYQRFREFMTAEVLAAIQGAKEAGATDIVVADSHGNHQNLLIERFPPDVSVVRGDGRPLGMMEGIDSTFDAVLFIGFHSSTGNLHGVRAHTISSARFTSLELNGAPAAESRLNAAVAGYFGVPVVLISGDDVATAELAAVLGSVETAVVKQAIGFHAAKTLTPEAAQSLIRAKAKSALQRRTAFKPYVLRAPVRLDLSFKSYRPVEMLGLLPIVERTSSHSIRYNGPTILDVVKFLVFVGGYSVELEP